MCACGRGPEFGLSDSQIHSCEFGRGCKSPGLRGWPVQKRPGLNRRSTGEDCQPLKDAVESGRMLKRVFKKAMAEAGLPPVDVTANKLRHMVGATALPCVAS